MIDPLSLQIAVQLIHALIAAEPQIVEGVKKGKALIEALFTSKLINAEQQAALHNHVDGLGQLAEAGIPPLAWTVEPDPVA